MSVTKSTFKTASTLTAAVAVSIAAWVFSIVLLQASTSSSDLEGDLYLTGFVGALSFFITGPIAFIALKSLSEQVRLRPWQFAAYYATISLPTISFQVVASSSSIIQAFIPGAYWAYKAISTEMACATIACCLWYTVYFVVLGAISRRAPRWTAPTSVALIVCSFAALALRLFHM